MPFSDGCVQRGDVWVVVLMRERLKHASAGDALQRKTLLAHRPRDRVLAVLDGLFATFLGEPRPDLVASTSALDEAQPVAAWPGALSLRGEHLDDVTVVELALEGDELAVDPGPDTSVADLGVDGVGEVDRRGF